jgi:hypothetical protein
MHVRKRIAAAIFFKSLLSFGIAFFLTATWELLNMRGTMIIKINEIRSHCAIFLTGMSEDINANRTNQ